MPRFKFWGMFAASFNICFTIPVIVVDETECPARSIKTFYSKVIAAAAITRQFLISAVDQNNCAEKWGLHGISPLKYRILMSLDCVNTSLPNQASSLVKLAEILFPVCCG